MLSTCRDLLRDYEPSCGPSFQALAQADEKTVHLLDSNTGKPLGDGRPYTHRQEVVEVALEQTGPSHERKLAVIDKNRDLYLVRCGAPHPGHLDIGVHIICYPV